MAMHQPARSFTFTLSPPTAFDNGDEVVLTLVEDGVTSVWLCNLFDCPMATACHPEDAVVCLNRGDYMLVTNNHKCYPCKKNGNKLIMKDDDDEYEFYRQTDDDDDDADDK